MLTEKQVSDYQRIYKEYFGKEIDRKKAIEQGIKLIHFIKLILKQPDKSQEPFKELKDNALKHY